MFLNGPTKNNKSYFKSVGRGVVNKGVNVQFSEIVDFYAEFDIVPISFKKSQNIVSQFFFYKYLKFEIIIIL